MPLTSPDIPRGTESSTSVTERFAGAEGKASEIAAERGLRAVYRAWRPRRGGTPEVVGERVRCLAHGVPASIPGP